MAVIDKHIMERQPEIKSPKDPVNYGNDHNLDKRLTDINLCFSYFEILFKPSEQKSIFA